MTDLRDHACTVLDQTFVVWPAFVDAVVDEARRSADPIAAIDLVGVLSDLCEDTYCSSWDSSTVLAVRAGLPGRVGLSEITERDIARAHALAQECGGWWESVKSDDDSRWLRFVPMEGER